MKLWTIGVLGCGLVACVSTVPVEGVGEGQATSSSSSSSSSSGYNGSTSSGYVTTSSSSSGETYKPECTQDADCAFHDTDTDPCTTAVCSYNHCEEKQITDTPACQCFTVDDCLGYYNQRACNAIASESHVCKKAILPAGPAPDAYQKKGDCWDATCDGSAEDATNKADAADLGDDNNPCTVESCDATKGLVETNVANGTACGAGNICFEGKCLPCKPSNPASCGSEGAGEPADNSSATPDSFTQFQPMCTFSSGTDIDWYTFYAKGEPFSFDAFNFKLWSTAKTLEVCIYVKCDSGTPGNGCATKLPGPNGSLGCCWTGAPATLAPSWDLDCSGTGEDSGTTYMSVRTPGGAQCEQYAITGGY